MRVRARNGFRVRRVDDLCDPRRWFLHDEQSVHERRLQYETSIPSRNARPRDLFLHPSEPLKEVHAKALRAHDRGRVYSADVCVSMVPYFVCSLLRNGRSSQNLGHLACGRAKDYL